jgi:hypothetical protein
MRPEITSSLAAALALTLSGCFGVSWLGLSAEDPVPDGGDPTAELPTRPQRLFGCEGTQVRDELPLRRLSHIQLRHTVEALVTGIAPQSAAEVLSALQPVLSRFPEDARVGEPGQAHGGFTRLDQWVHQEHVDALHELGVLLGAQLTATPERRSEVFGACATDAAVENDAECLETFLTQVGSRVLRRPLEVEDVAFYRAVAGATAADPGALADVVALLVNSPGFFYLEEHGQPGPGAEVALDAFELANRLSYHFWQAPPDDPLWAAAARGDLLTDEGYRAEVDRLFSDPRSKQALDEFFAQWLRLDELPELDGWIGTPVFDAFAGADVPGPDLREAMIEDVLAAARYEVRRGGTLSDLLVNRRSFATDPVLARIVGAPIWDGSGEPPSFASDGRAGLLTRAAFLATGTGNTRPIMKGYLIRNALMCQQLPTPPANADLVPPEPSPTATTRERVEAITEGPGTSCAGLPQDVAQPARLRHRELRRARPRAVHADHLRSGRRPGRGAARPHRLHSPDPRGRPDALCWRRRPDPPPRRERPRPQLPGAAVLPLHLRPR